MNGEPTGDELAPRFRYAVWISDGLFVFTLLLMWWAGAGFFPALATAGAGLGVHHFLKPGLVMVGKPEWFERPSSDKPDEREEAV